MLSTNSEKTTKLKFKKYKAKVHKKPFHSIDITTEARKETEVFVKHMKAFWDHRKLEKLKKNHNFSASLSQP